MSDNSVSPIDIERQPTTERPSLVDTNRLDKEFVLERKTSLQYKKVKLKKFICHSESKDLKLKKFKIKHWIFTVKYLLRLVT